MTVVLEPPLAFGETVVAALVSTAIHKHHFGYQVAVTGLKRPIAILVRIGDQIETYTPQGDRVATSQLRALYPAPVAQFVSTEVS